MIFLNTSGAGVEKLLDKKLHIHDCSSCTFMIVCVVAFAWICVWWRLLLFVRYDFQMSAVRSRDFDMFWKCFFLVRCNVQLIAVNSSDFELHFIFLCIFYVLNHHCDDVHF